MNIIHKNSAYLTDLEINKMYDIIITNLKIIFDNFIEKSDDKIIWTSNIKKPICNFILCYEDDICAYLEYIKKENNYHICEIQIDNIHKGDGITFKKIMSEFYKIIENDQNYAITGMINDKNQKSIDVFTHIGMRNISNKLYEMNKSDLEQWLNINSNEANKK